MAKQLVPHKFILKINSTKLREAKWNLSLPLADARRNDEVVALGDSQMLRWIDELNGTVDSINEAIRVKAKIRELKRLPSGAHNRREIQKLYDRLDELQFKPDYMCLVIDRVMDYRRACKGFYINGIKYVRLLGTNGGVKMSTIVFVSERLAPELRRRIENGRHPTKQIPAKFEAYRALTCSGSSPVSFPHGILVVPDCETKFREDIIMLNDEGVDEPVMEFQKDVEITLDESDGYGLILPSLAERWSQELNLGYTTGAMTIRCSWTKGMVFAFDFHEFDEKIAGGKHIVKDAWGHDVDIRNVEMILTTSMLKLWESYDSIEHYLACCEENHHTFSVTKTAPKVLENRRSLNYQFIQSYHLTDEQIDELIKPTIDDIRGVLSGDYRKALVFLRGNRLTDDNVEDPDAGFAGALMVNPEMYNDPFVRKHIWSFIEKRIDDAKIGVLTVHGNYSIVSGDPYALCQNIFGLEVTGLLGAGEIYNRYWVDCGAKDVACFRAPMSTHSNIRRMHISTSEQAAYWYRYIPTCTMLNAWDSSCAAWNGCDKDGDILFISDNRVLVENIIPEPTIFCVQRKAQKVDVTEESLIEANIASFGDDIGKTTNYITSMYDVQAQFEPGSPEYETLSYRIKCGQLFQQNCIDKAKGIVCKPMPRSWFDYFGNMLPDNPTDEDIARREFNLRIMADKKPYFMGYIYPKVMKQYKSYYSDANAKCGCLYRMSIDELMSIPENERTEEQNSMIHYYNSRMPVGMQNCVMNRICWKIEREFGKKAKFSGIDKPFDYTILKSGVAYKKYHYYAIKRLYEDHRERLQAHMKKTRERRVFKSVDPRFSRENLVREFKEAALTTCSNEQTLCDIVVDLCYKREGTKQFAWDVCGLQIIRNLLDKTNNILQYPILDPDGDFEYGGETFSMMKKESEVWARLS